MEIENTRKFVKLRGLPWSCTSQDVIEFLKDVKLPNESKSVRFIISRGGKSSGECIVEISPSSENHQKALKCDRKYIGQRYIEVSESTVRDFDRAAPMDRSGNQNQQQQQHYHQQKTAVLRLRGLPYDLCKSDLIDFFQGIIIVEDGIVLVVSRDGKFAGIAFVEFLNDEEAEKAMCLHKQNIGHRYVEIFRSNHREMEDAMRPKTREFDSHRRRENDPSPDYRDTRRKRRPMPRNESYSPTFDSYENEYHGHRHIPPLLSTIPAGRNCESYEPMEQAVSKSFPSTFGSLHLSNLPLNITEHVAKNLFLPISPAGVRFLYDSHGRMIGEAHVYFENHSVAVQALEYSASFLMSQGIRVALQSRPDFIDRYGNGRNMNIGLQKHSYNESNMQGTYPKDHPNFGYKNQSYDEHQDLGISNSYLPEFTRNIAGKQPSIFPQSSQSMDPRQFHHLGAASSDFNIDCSRNNDASYFPSGGSNLPFTSQSFPKRRNDW